MKIKTTLCLLCFSLLSICAGLVTSRAYTSIPAEAGDEIKAVDKVIDDFQTAYSSKNITEVQNLFHHKAVVGIDFFANNEQTIMTLSEWSAATKSVFKEKPWISDELSNRKISIEGMSLATVVCDYNYRDPASHQAGTDIFTLIKIRGKWKIISLIFSGDNVKK